MNVITTLNYNAVREEAAGGRGDARPSPYRVLSVAPGRRVWRARRQRMVMNEAASTPVVSATSWSGETPRLWSAGEGVAACTCTAVSKGEYGVFFFDTQHANNIPMDSPEHGDHHGTLGMHRACFKHELPVTAPNVRRDKSQGPTTFFHSLRRDSVPLPVARGDEAGAGDAVVGRVKGASSGLPTCLRPSTRKLASFSCARGARKAFSFHYDISKAFNDQWGGEPYVAPS